MSYVSGAKIRISFGKMKNNLFFFGILFDLDKFLTLKNANKFVFSSLNRNFALSLQPISRGVHECGLR